MSLLREEREAAGRGEHAGAPRQDGHPGEAGGGRCGSEVGAEVITRHPGRPSPEPPASFENKLNAQTEHITPTQRTPFSWTAGGSHATTGGLRGHEVEARGPVLLSVHSANVF